MNDKNKLRWDCNKQGCFNVKKRPKLEVFYDSIPGASAFGDIDAIVEVCGNFLVLEYKGRGVRIPTGQLIMYERMTASGQFTVFVVTGDCETMQVYDVVVFWKDKQPKREPITLDALKRKIERWVTWATKKYYSFPKKA